MSALHEDGNYSENEMYGPPAAPLSPFKHGTWDIAEDGFGLGRAIDNLGMYVYTNDARAALAAAQSHFDRTMAENTDLKERNLRLEGTVSRLVGERNDAKARAAEAEKDAAQWREHVAKQP
jgi:hypothetical protein